MPAMHVILNVLRPGSLILICTNLRWLIDEAAVQFHEFWQLETVYLTPVTHGSRLPLTRFEKKYLERGETCYEMQLRVPD
ncbi:MAG: hypothetical protein ACFHXK_18725 [bacterium]